MSVRIHRNLQRHSAQLLLGKPGWVIGVQRSSARFFGALEPAEKWCGGGGGGEASCFKQLVLNKTNHVTPLKTKNLPLKVQTEVRQLVQLVPSYDGDLLHRRDRHGIKRMNKQQCFCMFYLIVHHIQHTVQYQKLFFQSKSLSYKWQVLYFDFKRKTFTQKGVFIHCRIGTCLINTDMNISYHLFK